MHGERGRILGETRPPEWEKKEPCDSAYDAEYIPCSSLRSYDLKGVWSLPSLLVETNCKPFIKRLLKSDITAIIGRIFY